MPNSFDLKKIADLAYLKISKEDEQKLAPKIKQVIEYIGKIQNLKLEETGKQERPAAIQRFREDEVKPQKVEIAKLSNFIEENYFIVPKVIQDFE
jgi:aspartyl/glutamyl-tRNA(Asn/Gln) amidotransferase C subunit